MAHASEVKFPQGKPRLSMTVPDDWSVTYTDVGVEARSPTKDSLVVANVLKHEMTTVDAWKAKVLTVMKAGGVTVATSPTSGAAPATTSASQAGSTAKPKEASQDLPGDATTPSFSLAGGPSLDTPTLPTGMAPLEAHVSKSTDTPAMAAPPSGQASKGGKKVSTINGLRFQSYRLLGGQFKDKPTDMQLVLYFIPKDEFAAVEQQSDPSDNRAAAILNSVKLLGH